jgi:3-hydroxyacyl-CoA dehydrogenase
MDIDDVEQIAVLGAGNMGHGIAEVATLAGYEVSMRDINEEFVQNGYEQVEWSLDKLAEKDQITQGEADAALDRLVPVVDLEVAVGDADVVIEAVPEKMDIKKEVYREVEEYAPEEAIFATNTSSLSVTELSEVCDRPEQFCGMHFFNPPFACSWSRSSPALIPPTRRSTPSRRSLRKWAKRPSASERTRPASSSTACSCR